MKHNILFLLSLLMCLALPIRAESNIIQALGALQREALLMRSFQQQFESQQPQLQAHDPVGEAHQQRLRQVLAIRVLKHLGTKSFRDQALGSDFFRYYLARWQVMAGKNATARETLVPLASRETVALEAIDGLFELDEAASKLTAAGGKRRIKYWTIMGKLFPISSNGSWAANRALRHEDSQNVGQEFITRSFMSSVPAIIGGRLDNNLAEVSELFYSMKMYKESAPLSVEAIYSSFGVARIMQYYQESWLSSITAPLWLQAAQSEWEQGGDVKKAANYLAKAIVYGSSETAQEALKVVQQWQQNPQPQQPPAAEPDRLKLKKIAYIYVGMNMHPRALEIIKQYRDVLGPEAATMQEKFEKSWLKVLRSFCGVNDKCLFYGQDISQPEKRLTLTFPPTLSEEALAEAAKTMRELVKP